MKFISGLASTETPEQYSCTWEIGRELLDIQSNFTENNLNEYIEKEKLNEIADYYIKELYNQKYARTLYYSSYEIHPLDENNGKWIIFFIYVTKEHHGTLKNTEDWFIERAQSMKGAEWEQIAEWIKENQDERLELEMHLSDWEESQYGDY